MNPYDLVKDTVNRGVLLGTRKYGGVALDGYDIFPTTRKCKGYGVATSTSEEVN
jgi:hypothetical protein